MGAIVQFLRAHRWQRRALTLFLAVALGAGGAMIFQVPIRTWLLLRDLDNPDPAVRRQAVRRGIFMAAHSPEVLAKLNAALDSSDDVRFYAITRVLGALGRWRTEGRDGNQLDRLRLIEFLQLRPRPGSAGGSSSDEASSTAAASGRGFASSQNAPARTPSLNLATSHGAPSHVSSSQSTTSQSAASKPSLSPAEELAASFADSRLQLLQESIFAGRDNIYNRRLLAAAAKDDDSGVREASAILAARFRDANTLLALLADSDLNVVEWAAIDAGLARMHEMTDRIRKVLLDSNNPDVVSGCARAMEDLWIPPPPGYSHGEPKNPDCDAKIQEANDLRLFSRCPWAFWPNSYNHERYVLFQEGLRKKGEYMPAALLIPADTDEIKRILRAAVGDANGLTRNQVLRAVSDPHALEQLPNETEALLRGLWSPENSLVLVSAARALGGDIRKANAAEQNHILQTLRQAALYETGGEPNAPDYVLAVPAAAAAVALWQRDPSASFLLPPPPAEPNAPPRFPQIDPNATAYLIYHASCGEHQLVPDYIAWNLSRPGAARDSGGNTAFDLGMEMLPPPQDPRDPSTLHCFRNYSVNSRCTGALLLALAARTQDEKKRAEERIAARLAGGPLGAPTDYFEIGTYKCALLILGHKEFAGPVADLLQGGAFPARRAITALCLAGDKTGLDWLLWDLRASPREIGDILVGTLLNEVIEKVAPELPRVDPAAEDDLRDWQVKVLRNYYRIHREKIQFERAAQE